LRFIFLTFLFFISTVVLGQGWNERRDRRIVYHDYDNFIWLPLNHSAEHNYTSSSGQLSQFDDRMQLFVDHYEPRIVIYQKSKKTKRLVDSLELTVLKYPTPTVCWNNRTADKNRGVPVCIDSHNDISLHTFCILSDVFFVDSTIISIGNHSYTSPGSILSMEVCKAIWSQSSDIVNTHICVHAHNQRGKRIKVCEDFKVVNPFFIGHYRTERITAIHRDQTTEFLFDEKNPFSFVGYAQRTVLTNVFPMSYRSVFEALFRFTHLNSYEPELFHSKAPIFDSIGCDYINEMGHFIYSAHPLLFFDRMDINCVLLVKESPINFPFHAQPRSRMRVIFAKNYDNASGKMEFVFSFLLEELQEAQLGLYVKELPSKIIEEFWSENQNTGILPLMECCKNQNDTIKTTYKPSWRVNDCEHLYYFPILEWYNILEPKLLKIYNSSNTSGSFILPETRRIEPFKNFLFSFGKYLKVDSVAVFDAYSVFEKGNLTYYKTEEFDSTKPIIDAQGNKTLLYQTAAFYYAYKKDIRAYQVFEMNRSGDSLVTTKVLVTLLHEGDEIPFLLVQISDLTQFDYLRQFNSFPVANLPWKHELKKASSFARVYHPNNSDDLKELDTLYYLDAFEGRPLNLLNICLSCD